MAPDGLRKRLRLGLGVGALLAAILAFSASLVASGAPSAPSARIAAGRFHTCLLTSAGGVKCWGRNGEGQLGNGSTISRSTPVAVVGLTSTVNAIGAGMYHTCALTIMGGAKCWGWNVYGQLGNGETAFASGKPVDVVGLTSGVSAIAPGDEYTCALTSAGSTKCWGSNTYGQLGNGSKTRSSTPVDVVGLTGSITAIATGSAHTCALTSAGGVKCWGYNTNGELGNGSIDQSRTPVDVAGLTSGVSAIAAGSTHTCALMRGGGVKCWGAFGSRTGSRTPVDVAGLTSGVTAIAAGGGVIGGHTCALTSAGGVKCWGSNDDGQLGNGASTAGSTAVPVDVTGLASGATAIAAGWEHTCALTRVGGVKCWGRNSYGELGNDSTAGSSTPVDVLGLTTASKTVAEFFSPSRNLSCEMADRDARGSYVYCQSLKAPHSVRLTLNGRLNICRGISCLGNAGENTATLAYGKQITVGRFRCLSQRAGARCTVVQSRRGFVIDKIGVRRIGA